jgi:hypothetical protein
MPLGLASNEGLGRSAGSRVRIVPMKLAAMVWQKAGCGASQGRTDTGAQCPRVRLVLGDVIDIGEHQALVFLEGRRGLVHPV